MKIIFDINLFFLQEVERRFPGDRDRLRRMSIIQVYSLSLLFWSGKSLHAGFMCAWPFWSWPRVVGALCAPFVLIGRRACGRTSRASLPLGLDPCAA